mgnify:CR=1 FL=1
MPIYEYKCNNCDNQFEVLTTSVSDEKTIGCDKCGDVDITKLLSAGSFKLSTNSSAAPGCQQSGCGANRGFS